jgi:site-specific recombinase XerD
VFLVDLVAAAAQVFDRVVVYWLFQSTRTLSAAATGRRRRPTSIVRRLPCLSQFYDYGIKGAELLEHSRVSIVRAPKVSDATATVGLTAAELARLLAAPQQQWVTGGRTHQPPRL